MDFGREYQHIGKIRPFRDRPDIEVRVLWFPVPLDTPNVPYASPYVLRTYDVREQLPQTELGTVQDYREPYNGPLPINLPGVPCGTRDQWENGLFYSEFLASQCSCSCPEPIYMGVVNSVRNDDGSLHVDPIVGDVEVHIDTTHTNAWAITQVFKSGNVLQPAAEFQGLTGQTAAYLQARRSTGQLAWGIVPVPGEVVVQQSLLHVDGTVGFSVDSRGNALFDNEVAGGHLEIVNAADTTLLCDELTVDCSAGALEIRGQTTVSRDAADSGPLPIDADLLVLQTDGSRICTFAVGRDNSLGARVTFAVYDDPGAFAHGLVEVCPSDSAYMPSIRATASDVHSGLIAKVPPATGGVYPAIGVITSADDVLFGANAAGDIFTANAKPATTPGTVIARLAIYDGLGTLVGYLPLYDSIT